MSDFVYVILFVVLIVIIIILIMYNRLVRLYNKVKKAKANIEVYLNKRFDLIPNLVECVKSYGDYESKTLEDIVLLRNNYNKTENMKIKEVDEWDSKLNKCLAVVEKYPDLKANEEYMNLQRELRNIEDQLQRARNIYNDEATNYNIAIEVVPSNIIAIIFAFKKVDLFKIEDSKKENIKINKILK